jgi:phospholipase C
MIAQPDGWTPFDHASVIATVQNCLGLPGNLTARDAAAPDLSCVLTLDTPRQDIPEVQPLPYEIPDERHVNALHLVMEDALTELTGQLRPEGKDLFEFISESYHNFFDTG